MGRQTTSIGGAIGSCVRHSTCAFQLRATAAGFRCLVTFEELRALTGFFNSRTGSLGVLGVELGAAN